jgi:DNA polymerase delta subunit 1
MWKRDKTGPTIGDRVFYVIVEGPRGCRAYEKSEDPVFAMENNIPIDTDYYLNQQLSGPLTRLFSPIMDNITPLLNGPHTRKIRKPQAVFNASSNGKNNSSNSTSSILSFVRVDRSCIGCRVKLGAEDNKEKNICRNCEEKEGEYYMEGIKNVKKAEEEYGNVMSQCQRCSSSLHKSFLCNSRDCPLFYLRTKVKKDLEDCCSFVNKFGVNVNVPHFSYSLQFDKNLRKMVATVNNNNPFSSSPSTSLITTVINTKKSFKSPPRE